MNFVLIGAPLSGKGTLGKLLSEHFKIPHISMGDLLRNVANGKTKYSTYIATIMKEGKLINDDLAKVILEDRLSKSDCKKGFILDGYPRNMAQAEMLDTIVTIDKVVYSTVSEVTLIDRLAHRFICPKCGLNYNSKEYSKTYCEKCNTALTKRVDDNEETLLKRIKAFNEATFPVLNKYMDENKLVTISNEGDINIVFAELLEKL